MITNLIGMWKLLDCRLFNIKGEEIPDPFSGASGLIIYDANRLMSVQIMKEGHVDSIPGNFFDVPAETVKQAFLNYAAYYGRYSIDEEKKTVTHFVSGSLWPNMINEELVRNFEFEDDNIMVLSPVDYEKYIAEAPVKRYLTWSRIR